MLGGAIIGFALFSVAYLLSLYLDACHFGCGGRWKSESLGDGWELRTCSRCGKQVRRREESHR
jgi:hypothetical protein